MTSPTARTLATLRDMGYVAQTVERWNQYARVRQDLFGCIDVLAMHPEHGLLAVQATSATNLSSRMAKCLEEPRCELFLRAGGRFEIWIWSKRGDRGKRKLWALRRHAGSVVDGSLVFTELASVSKETAMDAAR